MDKREKHARKKRVLSDGIPILPVIPPEVNGVWSACFWWSSHTSSRLVGLFKLDDYPPGNLRYPHPRRARHVWKWCFSSSQGGTCRDRFLDDYINTNIVVHHLPLSKTSNHQFSLLRRNSWILESEKYLKVEMFPSWNNYKQLMMEMHPMDSSLKFSMDLYGCSQK